VCWRFTGMSSCSPLSDGQPGAVITVVMAQFVTEMGTRWNLMSATAVMALVPAFLLALFGQKS